MSMRTVGLLLVVAFVSGVVESEGLRLLAPADEAVVYMPHPHLRWQKGADAEIEDRYQIQIARDDAFRLASAGEQIKAKD
jgi:hypothetical protein